MALHHMLRAAAGNAGPSDPNFENVTLLLTGNGTNGAQNNTFLDSSSNNFTITRNGNTTQGTFSPYGNLWSNYFDGSGDYLQVPSNSAFDFGTGNFTIEAWVNITGINSFVSIGIATRWSASSTNWLLRIVRSGSVYNSIVFNANDGEVSANYTFNQNTWYHVAAVRNGSSFRFYVNGVDIGGGTVSWNIAASSEPVKIGANGYSSFEYWWPGYISNIRIVKGTALYTSSFTPPTSPLTAVSGTSLLTCQSNRFIDNSSNNFTLTVNGNTSVQRFSPFNPTAPYSASTIGGSGYFDGTGDYLSIASNTAFALGTGDFTIEFWLYPTSTTQRNVTFATVDAPIVYMNTSRQLELQNYGVVSIATTTNTLNLNAWNHCVATRQSGTLRLFINGVQGASVANSSNWVQSAVNIGTDAGTNNCNGYMTAVRILKGTGYSAITVPTEPPTAITNTSLLLNFTNAGIPDAAMMNDLETVGNAQVSTSVVKYGTGSLAFDGTGDYLITPSSPNLQLGSGNFTVEMWIWKNANTAYMVPCGNYLTASTNTFQIIGDATGTKIAWYNGASNSFALTSSSNIELNTWTHIAFVRNSGTLTLYINGVSNGTPVSLSTDYNAATSFVIGNTTELTSGRWWNGYIDDIRITKGYARYTANFTPPTAALPTY